jgi:hypothetical protein
MGRAAKQFDARWLTYGVDGDRIDRANFRIIGVGNRGLSGIVYRIKVCMKQDRAYRGYTRAS